VDTERPEMQDGCTLSIHRAFVVRLYADFDPSRKQIRGQVECVVSGEGGEFRSIDELLQFMNRVLEKRRSERR
jgi:hypothetical protein